MGSLGQACREPGWAGLAAVAGGARWDRLWAAKAVVEAAGPGAGPGRLRRSQNPEYEARVARCALSRGAEASGRRDTMNYLVSAADAARGLLPAVGRGPRA